MCSEEAQGQVRAKKESWGVTSVYVPYCLHGRLMLDVPDSLFMMEEAEGAQDPFFGLMETAQLPSPYKVHQVQPHTLIQPYMLL